MNVKCAIILKEFNVPFPVLSDSNFACSIFCFAVDRGLFELRKLGIEQQLWEASRKEIDQPSAASLSNHKDLDNSL